MPNLAELLAQKEALEKQINSLRHQERKDNLALIRDLIKDFDYTPDELFGNGKSGGVAPKYRDPATGVTWSGRGKPPKWIKGQDYAQFAI